MAVGISGLAVAVIAIVLTRQANAADDRSSVETLRQLLGGIEFDAQDRCAELAASLQASTVERLGHPSDNQAFRAAASEMLNSLRMVLESRRRGSRGMDCLMVSVLLEGRFRLELAGAAPCASAETCLALREELMACAAAAIDLEVGQTAPGRASQVRRLLEEVVQFELVPILEALVVGSVPAPQGIADAGKRAALCANIQASIKALAALARNWPDRPMVYSDIGTDVHLRLALSNLEDDPCVRENNRRAMEAVDPDGGIRAMLTEAKSEIEDGMASAMQAMAADMLAETQKMARAAAKEQRAADSAGQPASEDVRGRLLATSGEQYLVVRTEALALDDASFLALIQALESSKGPSLDRILASALQVRRTNPSLAAEFDDHLKSSVVDARPGASGRPIYLAWWPVDRPELDPLGFEVIVKKFVPEPLRMRFDPCRPHVANVNSILYLVETEGLGRAHAVAVATANSPEEQLRVTPLLVELHKKLRAEGSRPDSGAVDALSNMGGAAQLKAMKELRAFELDRLRAEGLMPPDDTKDADVRVAAVAKYGNARIALESARASNKPPAEIERLSRELEACKNASEVATRPFYARIMWEQIERRIQEVESKLAKQSATAR